MGKIDQRENAVVDRALTMADEAWQKLKVDPFLRLDFQGAEVPSAKTLVSVSELNWRFADTPELWPTPVSFAVQGSQRWHLTGRNGSGKSTLVKLIVDRGLVSVGEMRGSIRVNSSAVAYLDQRYGLLDRELSVFENIRLRSRLTETEMRNELAFCGFTKEAVFQTVKTLSGGELLKASLALMFLAERLPELIILDEPTNNLDFSGVELLEGAIAGFKGAVIAISHDREFIRKMGMTHELELV
jgi:ATPase subunit of ABC transporter with duplicated ATPase domains